MNTLTIMSQKDAEAALSKAYEQIKKDLNVDHVINYDIIAINSALRELNIGSWGDYEYVDTIISKSDSVRIATIDFNYLADNISPAFKHITGKNKSTATCENIDEDGDTTFYDDDINIVLAFNKEGYERMRQHMAAVEEEKFAWKHYEENVKGKMNELGVKFEVKESIYWHFLEVLPPIYGNGCFYCSEPVKHTSDGRKVYHKLTTKEGRFYIELNTIEK